MFSYTATEKSQVEAAYFSTEYGLFLKTMPRKQKKRYIALVIISQELEPGKKYSEKEINEILEPIYEDYVMLRRYLIDYKLVSRELDGSAYWLTEKE